MYTLTKIIPSHYNENPDRSKTLTLNLSWQGSRLELWTFCCYFQICFTLSAQVVYRCRCKLIFVIRISMEKSIHNFIRLVWKLNEWETENVFCNHIIIIALRWYSCTPPTEISHNILFSPFFIKGKFITQNEEAVC